MGDAPRTSASGAETVHRLLARMRRVLHPFTRPGVVRWTRRVLWVVFAVAVCHIGGATATSVFPAHVETDHYRADASLDIAPWQTSRLRAFTTVGDAIIDFDSPIPAPGIEARPQVRMSLIDSVSSLGNGTTVEQALLPSSAEVEDAGRTLILSLGLRYLGGGGVVALVLVLTHRLHGRRWLLRQIVTPMAAVVVALAVTAGTCAFVYRPDRVSSYQSTELLAALDTSPAVLEQIEQRAGQVAPYLTNWITLQRTLQDRFIPAGKTETDSVRFMLVSDIHGTNEYSVVKKVIEEEHIDAVIDAGDLVNFGKVEEGELANLFSSIASLGVPYLFVDGNHDASSPTDTALLRRMAQIPNVRLLQPDADDYSIVTIDGVRISGLNDPRYFGDDNSDAPEKPAADRFDETMKDVADLDLVVAHDPVAAEAIDVGRLRINGHIHTAALGDRRIQVGTLTGGGLMSYYRMSPEENGELQGQPQAFDILRFNADCTVNSLQRFVFSDLIEGSPRYDSISIINGPTLGALPPSADRTCENAGEGPTVTTVSATPADDATDVDQP